MNKHSILTAPLLLLATAGFTQQPASMAPNPSAATPELQIQRLVGDQYLGFLRSCLLVYSDGRYRREFQRQQSMSGHAQGAWHPPMVFEGTLSVDEMHRLGEIVESERFASITGITGDLDDIRFRLVISPGGVFPHTDMEIFAASVSHAKGPQVFEIIGNHPEKSESVQPLKKWITVVEKKEATRIDSDAASFCALSRPPAGSHWQPLTRLNATPSYTPTPDYPIGAQKGNSASVVTVRAVISADGSVEAVSIQRRANPALDQSALDAVKKWKFSPAVLYGFPLPSRLDVEVRFHAN